METPILDGVLARGRAALERDDQEAAEIAANLPAATLGAHRRGDGA